MSELSDDRLPQGTPNAKGVRGSLVLASLIAGVSVLLLVANVLFDWHDRAWVIRSAVMAAIGIFSLVLEYRRPANEKPVVMRYESLSLGILGLILMALVAAWAVARHMY